MKYNFPQCFLIFMALLLSACDLFDPEDSTPYTTYITTVAGNGYDVGFDLLETSDAYIMAGALGPQCDIVDAFMAKLDKETGAIFNLKTFGETNQGIEENFFSVRQVQGGFAAVGFSLKKMPPVNDTDLFCFRDTSAPNEGQIFFATVNEQFQGASSQYLDQTDTTWESGFDLVENPVDGGVLIGGAWLGQEAVIKINGGTASEVIQTDSYIGDIQNLLVHSSGRVFTSGHEIRAATGFIKINFYWAELDLADNRLVNEKVFFADDPITWPEMKVNAIAEAADANLLFFGHFKNDVGRGDGFLLKTDLAGNKIFLKTLSWGSNNEIEDVVAVADGYVIAGLVTPFENPTGSDALIAKIDEEGNILWQEFHDLRGNNESASTIIQTSDGGFLLSGQTSNFENGIRTILLIKTDGEGKVE